MRSANHLRRALPPLFVALALVLAPTALAGSSPSATVTWIGSNTGFWDVGSNWSSGTPPGATDAVVIGAGNTVTHRSGADSVISLSVQGALVVTGGSLTVSAASTLAALTLSGGSVSFGLDTTLSDLSISAGTLGGGGTVTVNGTLAWAAGTMEGPGKTVVNGPMDLTTGYHYLGSSYARTLENYGTTTWTGGQFYFHATSLFDNRAGATFDVQTNDQLYGSGTFRNAGTLRRSGVSGSTSIGVAFDNLGQVRVQNGTLNLSGGGTSGVSSTGAYTVTAGATLQFGGGTHNLTAASSINAASGTVVVSGGTLNTAGSYAAGTSTFSGGNANFTGVGTLACQTIVVSGGRASFEPDVVVNNLTLSSGTLAGGGTLTINGALDWAAGTMEGPGKTVVNGPMNLTTGYHYLGGSYARTLENNGTTTWTGGILYFYANSLFDNRAGATFDVQTDDQLYGSGTFRNAGTLRKSTVSGTTNVSTAFDNLGGVSVQVGALGLNGGGTSGVSSTGAYTVTAGATLQFGGGTHNLTAASSISAASGTVVVSGGTLNMAGSYAAGTSTFSSGASNLAGSRPLSLPVVTVSGGVARFQPDVTIGSLALSGGTLAGGGTITVTRDLNWSSGIMEGPGRTVVSGSLAIGTTGYHYVGNTYPRTLENRGTATWTDGVIYLNATSVIDNRPGALFDVQTEQQIYGIGTFRNNGTFRKSAGPGPTSVSISFQNAGTVEVNVAGLTFSSAYVQTAGTTTLGGASLVGTTFDFQGGSLTGNGTITGTVTNGGEVAPGPGTDTLNIRGNYTQSAAGVLNIEVEAMSATQTAVDLVQVSGIATLQGTLRASVLGGVHPGGGTVSVFVQGATRSGVFATTYLAPGLGVVYDAQTAALVPSFVLSLRLIRR